MSRKPPPETCENCGAMYIDNVPGIGAPGYLCGSYPISLDFHAAVVRSDFCLRIGPKWARIQGERTETENKLREMFGQTLEATIDLKAELEHNEQSLGDAEVRICELEQEVISQIEIADRWRAKSRKLATDVGVLRHLISSRTKSNLGNEKSIAGWILSLLERLQEVRPLFDTDPHLNSAEAIRKIRMWEIFADADRLQKELNLLSDAAEAPLEHEDDGLMA